MFPSRNTFIFENGVRITSEFESGNLWKCQDFLPEQENVIPELHQEPDEEEVKKEESQGADDASDGGEDDNTVPNGEEYDEHDTVTLFAPTQDELYCYDLWLCPDSLPYVAGQKQRA